MIGLVLIALVLAGCADLSMVSYSDKHGRKVEAKRESIVLTTAQMEELKAVMREGCKVEKK